MDWSVLWFVLAGLLVLVGLAGTVLPVLPGLPVMFAGMLLAAWAGGFERIGFWTLLVLGLLTALALLVDLLASLLGAQRMGASRKGLAGAAIGGVVGLFFGLPGLVLGPFLGAVGGELLHVRDLGRAGKVGVATWIGLVVGAALKVALAITMLGVFAIAFLLGGATAA